MDSTYMYTCIHIYNVIIIIIPSQYVFVFVENPCAVSGMSHSGVYGVAGRPSQGSF